MTENVSVKEQQEWNYKETQGNLGGGINMLIIFIIVMVIVIVYSHGFAKIVICSYFSNCIL